MSFDSPLIVATALADRLASDDTRVVDCRFDLFNPLAGRKAWLDGHIPGAVHADLDKDLAAPVDAKSGRHPLPDADAFCATLGRLGIGNDTHVVVYDAGPGAIAARAWWLLRWLGHRRVTLLDGGLAAWLDAGGDLEEGLVVVESKTFTGVPRNEYVMTTGDLCADGGKIAPLRLVDARDATRFRGDEEPIDSIAGHVPGALNLPFSRNLDEEGRWLDADSVRNNWRETLGEDLESPLAVMCGSGVTACHLAVAAELAGMPAPQVYVGSWSEWIRDPGRPIGTGAAGP